MKAMANTTVLHILLLVTCWRYLVLCADITLDTSATAGVLGRPFTFTCRVEDADVTGLVQFSIQEKGTYGSVCRLMGDTGEIVGNISYLCSREDGQPNIYTLTIGKVSLEHDTSWMCQAAGMKSNTLHLNVHYPPSLDIRPVEPCTGYIFPADETNVSLNCFVTAANPSPSNFTWYHGGNIVGRDRLYNIPRVFRSSSGHYRCVADNGVSPPGEDNVTVEVQYPPVVHIDDFLRVVKVSEDLTLHCTADANPEVTSLVWTEEGAGGRISMNGTLHLKDIQKTDAGVYVCTAFNTVLTCNGTRHTQQSSSNITLEVQYAPDIQYFGVTSGDRNVIVTEHDNVTLQCDISSNPASTIEIRSKTSSIGSGTNSETVEASIEDVGCRQTGLYTCSARNVIGKAVERNISLQVKCAPRPYGSTPGGPVFKSSLNRTVTLSLTAIAFPEPTVTWSKSPMGKPLTNTNVTVVDFRVTGSLTILEVQEEDFTNYTVNVTNTEGTWMLNVVLMSPSQPDVPRNLQASSVKPRSVTLKWEKGSNGGAKQSFRIQYRQGGRQWITHPSMPSEDDALQVELEGLEAETTYTVQMLALNGYGSSNHTSISVTTTCQTCSTFVVAVGAASSAVVIFIIIVTVVVVVRNRRRRQSEADAGVTFTIHEDACTLTPQPAPGRSQNYPMLSLPPRTQGEADDMTTDESHYDMPRASNTGV
ncbi:hemicentin-2-like [Haliotis rufescens]|uniref:hemicentin-2-like n=1 Tax=Haliotis rufescens TaxID=6454 RepID=UPI00201EB422|nr:hemicentin-2-like [Haliotis rufescens]